MANAPAKVKNSLPAVDDYAKYAGGGFENQTNEDVTLPFFEILQGQSPELTDLDGAKPGMIINKVTHDLFPGKDGIRFIPSLTEHVYVEWVPREKGGGIVASYPLTDPIVAEARASSRFGKYEMKNGNELIETFYVYGLAVSEAGEAMPAVLAFTSTKIRPYQSWMTQARSLMGITSAGKKFQYPIWSHVWRLRAVKVERNNYTWYNWQVGFDGDTADVCRLAPNDPLFELAMGVKEAVQSGAAKADLASQDQPATTDGASPGQDPGKPPF